MLRGSLVCNAAGAMASDTGLSWHTMRAPVWDDVEHSAVLIMLFSDDDDEDEASLSPDNITLSSLFRTEKKPLSSTSAPAALVELWLEKFVKWSSECIHVSSGEKMGKPHEGCSLDEDICVTGGDKGPSVTFTAAAAVSSALLSSSLTTIASWSDNSAAIATKCS